MIMTLTTNEFSGCRETHCKLFVQPFNPSWALRLGSKTERMNCTRRPRHDILQTNVRSRSFLGGFSETGMMQKNHESVSGKSHTGPEKSGNGRGKERSTTIAMSGNKTRSEEDGFNRFEEEEDNRWRRNEVAREKGSELRDAFSSSRAEWVEESSQGTPKNDMGGESYKGWQRSDVAASSYAEWRESEIVDDTFSDGNKREQSMRETVANEKRNRKEEDESLTVISGGDLMKKFLSVPGYLFRELIVPISEVGSVLWYDMKMSVIDSLKGERRYFVDDVTDYDANCDETGEHVVDMEAEEEQLSVEERQILDVQESAMRAANKIQGTMIRLFGRLF